MCTHRTIAVITRTDVVVVVDVVFQSSFFATLFPNDPTSAFSLYRFFEPLCTASFFLLASFAPPLAVIVLCVVAGVASAVFLWVLQWLLQRERMREVVVTINPLFRPLDK